MTKDKLLKFASVALPIFCAAIGFVADRVTEEQRRAELREEMDAEIERKFAERFGTYETGETEELI